MENQEAFMLETQHVSKHYVVRMLLAIVVMSCKEIANTIDASFRIMTNSLQTDINLQVKKGEVICLIGPSGAGKSTYLRSLNQLETITGGKIFPF